MSLNLSPLNGRSFTDKERVWYEAYMATGNASDAARAIGITTSVKQYGYAMKTRLKEYIKRDLQAMIGNCGPDALETIYELSKSCEDPNVRLRAAQDLLNRAGYKEIQRVEVTIADKSDKELDDEIATLLKNGNVVDAQVIN